MKKALQITLGLVAILQIILLMKLSAIDSLLGVIFQIAPYFLGFGFGILTGITTRKVSNQAAFTILIGVLLYGAAIYMIGVIFFVLFNGGGVRDIVADPIPYNFIFPHPVFLLIGIVNGCAWETRPTGLLRGSST